MDAALKRELPVAHERLMSVNFIAFVFRELLLEGYPAERLLAQTNLSAALLQDPDFKCTLSQHQSLVLNAMDLTGDVHLGIHLGQRFNPLNVGLPAMAALSSDMLLTALRTLERFVTLNFSLALFDFEVEADQLVLNWNIPEDVGDIQYFVISSAMTVCERLLCLLLNASRVTEAVDIAVRAPKGWREVQSDLGFVMHFDALAHRQYIPKAFLNRPLASADPVVHQRMLRLCQQQLDTSATPARIVGQLESIIARRQFHNVPLAEAASSLKISSRSLRRYLAELNTSYRQVLDNCRARRARELLAIRGLPITSIAFDMGFADTSNFSRTFKRWNGCAPKQFRQRLAGQN